MDAMAQVVRTVRFDPTSGQVVRGRSRQRVARGADGLAAHLGLAAAHLPVVGDCGIGRGVPAAQPSVHDNFSELRLVVGGRGAIALGGRVHQLSPGSLVVMGPGDEHQTLRGETERLSVHFYLPPPPRRTPAAGDDPFLRFVLEAYPRAGVVALPPGDPVFAAMRRVIEARREGGVGADLQAGMALVEVLIHLARRMLLARDAGSLSHDQRAHRDQLLVHELQQAMRARLAEPITVSPLLAPYPLAANYLRGIFRRLVGCSLQDWWQRERMARAQELMREGLELAEVASAVGFDDYHYFLKRFKAVVGVSPGEWRRRDPRCGS